MSEKAESIFSFADFDLDTSKRRLLKNGQPVAVLPKAFDLLTVLVKNRGQLLSKDELLKTVWENQFVEENNLTVHISALRKIFGEKKGEPQFITTISGKGYKFIADVRHTGNFSLAENDRFNLQTAQSFISDDSAAIIGRDAEIAEIKRLLESQNTRLVTLTGAGGCGKTTLARKIADECRTEFPDGVFFIELAAVNNPELVVSAIANRLGVKETIEESLAEILTDFLRDKRILLITDNFEQILPAAQFLQKLLNSTGHLKILVTSRTALQLKTEHEKIVTPLALPPPETILTSENLNDYSAVELFVKRAQSVRRNFVLSEDNARIVSDICQKLDGLPLAIELAAARIKLLSPQSILSRLENSLTLLTGGSENVPVRQQTMRATIQWSYDLLSEYEKTVFRQLSVFAGGFGIEAAESVVKLEQKALSKHLPKVENGENCSSENGLQSAESRHANPTILDVLTSLVNNNLLSVKEKENGDVRLYMLEVVREFASELLEISGEKENFNHRHARYFMALGEEAEPHLMGEQSVEWLETLETESDNFRAALRWALENDAEAATRTAAAIRYYWIFHSHLTEGGRWLGAVLEKSVDSPTELRFKLQSGRAIMARLQGDYASARKYYAEGLEEGIQKGDVRQIAKANAGLGTVLQLLGELSAARACYEKSLEISYEINDEYGVAYSLICLGILARSENDLNDARHFLEKSLEILRKFGNLEAVSNNLNNLAAVVFEQGDYDSAQIYFREALEKANEVKNKINIIDSINGLAALAAADQNFLFSAQLSGAAHNLSEKLRYDKEPAERKFCEKYIAAVRRSLGERDFAAAYAEGIKLSIDQAVELARNSISEQTSLEIVIETHKFERFIIEEQIENE